MKPIRKILHTALALSMMFALSSDADDTESQQLTRNQASGLVLKGQLSKNIYRTEQKQESYEVDVPYEEQVEYTVDVPYEDTEVYEIQVPYEDSETYEEQVPYEDQEAYEEQIPYEVNEAYEEQIPYNDTETYQDTETTYTTEHRCENVTDYRESCSTERICRRNPVQEGTCVSERVCRTDRNGKEVCFDQKKCNPSTGGDEVCIDKDVCRREPYTRQECRNVQVPHTQTVTKTRTVVRYRTETRYHTVTKYRSETRYRTVVRYRTETRTRTVTRYRTEERTRTVVRTRQETRCCKTETRVRKETKCCITREVQVLDHVFNLPYVIRFPENAKLEADESEIVTSTLQGSENSPDIDVHIDSKVLTYKIDKSVNKNEAQIVLTVEPHIDSKDMGEGTISEFKALYHPDGYIITFKDVAVFRRVDTKYRIQILDPDKKVVLAKEETAKSQSVRIQTDIQLDESKLYTIQVATARSGIVLKKAVQFVTNGKLEIGKYGKEEVGEQTVSEISVVDKALKKILTFEDKGHINKIETKYLVSIVNADLEKVVLEKELLAKDVLSKDRKVEVDITSALEDTRPTYRVVLSVTRTGNLLKEQIQFRKLTEVKAQIDLESLKNPALVSGIEIKGYGKQAVISIVDKAAVTKLVKNTYAVVLKRKTLGFERKVGETSSERASFNASALSETDRYFQKGEKLIFEIVVKRENVVKKVVIATITKRFEVTVN